MSDEKIKAYVTKYALTEGVFLVDAEWNADYPGMISYGKDKGYCGQYAHGKDWHRTLEDAMNRAEEMRANKIVSLKKSIEKMEKLIFVVKDVK